MTDLGQAVGTGLGMSVRYTSRVPGPWVAVRTMHHRAIVREPNSSFKNINYGTELETSF